MTGPEYRFGFALTEGETQQASQIASWQTAT